MRNIFFLSILLIIISCKSKSSSEKDTVTDSTEIKADTTTVATGTLTKKLTFSGYEEGDYPHLVFNDPATGDNYDFGHPTENFLGTTSVVFADSTTSFGFRENGKAKGSVFTVSMQKKMVGSYDGNGQPIQAEEWRIINITQ